VVIACEFYLCFCDDRIKKKNNYPNTSQLLTRVVLVASKWELHTLYIGSVSSLPIVLYTEANASAELFLLAFNLYTALIYAS
jgi:hypothetical protein